jgi:extracellular factor (EF) 3-hydroxypalmitic acid methyl ester biosynthesis protein
MIAGTSVTQTPTLLFHNTRHAMLTWLSDELRAVARSWPKPHVFAMGDALAVLQSSEPHLGIVNVGGTLADVLHGRVPGRSLALAYAADLVGYLDDELARATIQALFRCVKPGGRLLVASFARGLGDVEYANTCREWCIVARDGDQVNYLLGRVPPEEIRSIERFHDPHRILSFIRLIRR